MKSIGIAAFAVGILLVPQFLGAQRTSDSTAAAKAIISVLRQQERGWNAGDIELYMKGYHNSPRTRFISGGTVTFGYDTVLARYRRGYPDAASMGTLAFTGIQIEQLSSTLALVYGKWELWRDKDHPWGMFTLILKKTKQGWRIIHDHTSIAT